MKITVFAAGSRGDIQPCLALTTGLQAAGYQLRLAAPEDFADYILNHGVAFHPLRGDVRQIMASETGQRFMGSGGGNPLKSIRAIRTMLAPVVMRMAQDGHDACRDADALICLGALSAFGRAIAENLHIPQINIEPAPLLPTRSFAAPAWPLQHDLGALHNRLSGRIMLQVIWLWYSPFVNAFRRQLRLPSCNGTQFYNELRSTPLLCAYSPSVIPQPIDWLPHSHVTGYFFVDDHAGWRPPKDLENFLAAGAPPVYIGFGSMAGDRPDQLAGIILEALEISGQRGLVLTGWGGLQTALVPGNVFVLDAAPHAWLFPRMSAVVHHGGAGTTAEGVRAGVPTIIIPFAFDQSFWGQRVRKMGLGPAPIPLKHLTADRLAAAIHAAVSDPGIRQRASSIGAAIRAENGIENAVSLVGRYFGAP